MGTVARAAAGWDPGLETLQTLTKSGSIGLEGPIDLARRRRTLNRLAAGLDARVPGTAGHSRRVSRYAAAAAKRLGLSGEEITRVGRAGALHDIGKVEVPAGIINKPEPLSEDEYTLVRRHADLGARMVADLGDGELVRFVRHHHERFDGDGYPQGLAGEEIPLGARIIAVADTFDALTSTRPYREAMRSREALRLLGSLAGSQLDPRVVAAFRGRYAGLRGKLGLRRVAFPM